MEEKRRNDLAASRAEEYAPRPTGGLFMAGVAGAGLLLAADAIISGFYGWRLRQGLRADDPTALLEPPRLPRLLPRALRPFRASPPRPLHPQPRGNASRSRPTCTASPSTAKVARSPMPSCCSTPT